MTEKLCPGCGVTQPLDNFYRSSANFVGRQAYCKKCSREARVKTTGQPEYKRIRAPGQTVSKPKPYKNREARGKAIRAAEKAKRLELMRDVIQFQGLS